MGHESPRAGAANRDSGSQSYAVVYGRRYERFAAAPEHRPTWHTAICSAPFSPEADHLAKNSKKSQADHQPPPLLQLLEQARPYAERIVWRGGVVPNLASKVGDCVDGTLEVMDEWDNHAAPAARDLLASDNPSAAIQLRDSGYVLGIAVGLLMRAPGGVR